MLGWIPRIITSQFPSMDILIPIRILVHWSPVAPVSYVMVGAPGELGSDATLRPRMGVKHTPAFRDSGLRFGAFRAFGIRLGFGSRVILQSMALKKYAFKRPRRSSAT